MGWGCAGGRRFPPPGDFAIRWRYPRMVRDASLDPENLRQPGQKKQRPPVETLFEKAMAAIKDKPMRAGRFFDLLQSIAGTRDRARELRAKLDQAEYTAELDLRERGVHIVWVGTPAQIARLREAASHE